MKHWFGYRLYDPNIDLEPRNKILEGPFETYQEAKKEKNANKAQDMLQTAIFRSETKEKAIQQLKKEPFSKL